MYSLGLITVGEIKLQSRWGHIGAGLSPPAHMRWSLRGCAGTKYYIETYGCALAEYESLIMRNVLEREGYTPASGPSEADVIIVNTCAVRLDTEQRIAERLEQLSRLYPSKRLVVAGCLARARPGLVRRIAPHASLLGPQAVHHIVRAARERVILLKGERDLSSLPRAPIAGRIATIMIQEGCRNKCSYCITKVSRGDPQSMPPRLIVEQVLESVKRGAVEIRLTGTDTAAYGVDLREEITLADLLSMIIDKLDSEGFGPDSVRIRVGMMTPEEALRILDGLLYAYKDRRVYKFFHIPVQSGSNKVLKIMGRQYTIEDFIGLHREVKNTYPDSLFATDIIVGHPGESDEEFLETVSLIEKLRFERVHLAQYSLRPHTRAASMPQVPDPVKKERSTIVTRLVERIGSEIYGSYRGKRVKALVTGRSFRGNAYTARLDNYFPIVLVGNSDGIEGRWVMAEVVDSSFFDLRGKVVEAE